MLEPDQETTKRLIILAIDDAWRGLRASFNELRSDDVVEPGACGDWSVNEVLWHISSWELLLMDALATPDDGYDYPEPNTEDFNVESIAEMAGASPRQVVERLEDTHRKLRDALAEMPASFFHQDHPRRYLIDEWSMLHYEEHAAQIAAWRVGRVV